MKVNVLVTGAAGNIGSSLVCKLVENKKYFVVCVDNLLTGDISKLPDSENMKFYNADVNDFSAISDVFEKYDFTYVFHFAAVVGVKRTLQNPLLVLSDIDGFKNILDLSVRGNVSRFFFSSSSEVYGESNHFPQNEVTTPLNARLPYAIVKNVGESYCKAFLQEHGLPYTIFRFFNTYGENQSNDFVLPRFVKLAMSNEDIVVYGDGSQTRTFCYIDDNVDTMIGCMSEGKFINSELNVGSNDEISILELAQLILNIVGSSSRIVHVESLPDGDVTRRNPDIQRMKSVLMRDLTPLHEGVKRLIASYTKAGVTCE